MLKEHLEPLGNNIFVYVNDKYHFSTDTILLADFAKTSNNQKCVEFGTGCGTIPLLWCRTKNNIKISAIEIQEDACKIAKKSVEYNNLADKITIINDDLNNATNILPISSFNLVVCNPPYKLCGAGIINNDNAKNIARHEIHCSLDDICKNASKLLQFGGRLCICQRPERIADAMECMRKYNIEPKTLRLVQARENKAPKLFLLEGRRGGKKGFLTVMNTLILHNDDGTYTEEMIKIYGNYKNDLERN